MGPKSIKPPMTCPDQNDDVMKRLALHLRVPLPPARAHAYTDRQVDTRMRAEMLRIASRVEPTESSSRELARGREQGEGEGEGEGEQRARGDGEGWFARRRAGEEDALVRGDALQRFR